MLCAVTVRDLLAYHAGQGGASHGGDGGYIASLHAQFAAEMEELRARFMPLERLLAAEAPLEYEARFLEAEGNGGIVLGEA